MFAHCRNHTLQVGMLTVLASLLTRAAVLLLVTAQVVVTLDAPEVGTTILKLNQTGRLV